MYSKCSDIFSFDFQFLSLELLVIFLERQVELSLYLAISENIKLIKIF